MLCICRLWVVALDVSDMFVVAGLQITTRLAYIRVVTSVAFQLVNARSIVWWILWKPMDYYSKKQISPVGNSVKQLNPFRAFTPISFTAILIYFLNALYSIIM